MKLYNIPKGATVHPIKRFYGFNFSNTKTIWTEWITCITEDINCPSVWWFERYKKTTNKEVALFERQVSTCAMYTNCIYIQLIDNPDWYGYIVDMSYVKILDKFIMYKDPNGYDD